MKAKLLQVVVVFIGLTISSNAADGASIYKKCAGCHGKDGKTKAFGKSKPIYIFSAEEILESLKVYRSSDFKQHGVAKVMAKQLKKLTEEELQAVSKYIGDLPK